MSLINVILIAITTFFIVKAGWLLIKGMFGYDSNGYRGITYSFYFFLCVLGWWTAICLVLWLIGFDVF